MQGGHPVDLWCVHIGALLQKIANPRAILSLGSVRERRA